VVESNEGATSEEITARMKRKESKNVIKRMQQEANKSPTLSQINELLLEHENQLHGKIDQS